MPSSKFFQSLAFLLLLSSIYCHEHHNNDRDHKWSVFVSNIQSFWKTDPYESQTESSVSTNILITEKDLSHNHRPHKNIDEDTNNDIPRIEIMNGTYITTTDDIETGVKLGLAWLISLPIVGIIVFIFCCYCCCKCCASMCSSDDKVVVMNSHVIAPPQQPQIIVQQPIIQHVQVPREMQQYPPQNPHWGPQNFQHPMPPPYYPSGGVDNPNFHGVDNPNFRGVDNPNFRYPSAPTQMTPEKY